LQLPSACIQHTVFGGGEGAGGGGGEIPLHTVSQHSFADGDDDFRDDVVVGEEIDDDDDAGGCELVDDGGGGGGGGGGGCEGSAALVNVGDGEGGGCTPFAHRQLSPVGYSVPHNMSLPSSAHSY
jgi:hypothetical protein